MNMRFKQHFSLLLCMVSVEPNPAALPSSTMKNESPESCIVMDSSIWSNMPLDLLECILAKLPPHAFLRYRTTCKHFGSLVTCPSFLSLHTPIRTSAFRPYLLLDRPHLQTRFRLFDTFRDQWRSFPFPSLHSSANLLCVSEGLLMLRIDKSPFIHVCNPITKLRRSIQLPCSSITFTSLNASNSHGYNIIASQTSSFYIYDSHSYEWNKIHGPDAVPYKYTIRNTAFCDGYFYVIFARLLSMMRLRLNEQKDIKWERLAAEIPLASMTFVRLMTCETKLFIVGGLGENGVTRSLSIWEVKGGEGGGKQLEELQEMPKAMCRKLMGVCYHNYDQLNCIGHGD